MRAGAGAGQGGGGQEEEGADGLAGGGRGAKGRPQAAVVAGQEGARSGLRVLRLQPHPGQDGLREEQERRRIAGRKEVMMLVDCGFFSALFVRGRGEQVPVGFGVGAHNPFFFFFFEKSIT